MCFMWDLVLCNMYVLSEIYDYSWNVFVVVWFQRSLWKYMAAGGPWACAPGPRGRARAHGPLGPRSRAWAHGPPVAMYFVTKKGEFGIIYIYSIVSIFLYIYIYFIDKSYIYIYVYKKRRSWGWTSEHKYIIPLTLWDWNRFSLFPRLAQTKKEARCPYE